MQSIRKYSVERCGLSRNTGRAGVQLIQVIQIRKMLEKTGTSRIQDQQEGYRLQLNQVGVDVDV